MYVPLFFLLLVALMDQRPVGPLVFCAALINIGLGYACKTGCCRKPLAILALADLVCGIQFAVFCLLAMMDGAAREALPILFVLGTGITLCWQLYSRPALAGSPSAPWVRGCLAGLGLLLVQICAPSTGVMLLLREGSGSTPWPSWEAQFLGMTMPLYYAPLWWLIAKGAGAADSEDTAANLPPMEDVLRDHIRRYPDERSIMARAVLRSEREWAVHFGLRFEDEERAAMAARELFHAAWNDTSRPRWREVSADYLSTLAESVFPPWFRPGDAAEGEGLSPDEEPAFPPARLRVDESLDELPGDQAELIRKWLSGEEVGAVSAEAVRRFREGLDRILTDVAAAFPARTTATPAADAVTNAAAEGCADACADEGLADTTETEAAATDDAAADDVSEAAAADESGENAAPLEFDGLSEIDVNELRSEEAPATPEAEEPS